MSRPRTRSTETPAPYWLADALKDAPPILSLDEAIALTRLSERQLRRFAHEGRIASVRDGVGRQPARLRFPRAAIARYLTEIAQ